jgi:hypothetical protein
MNAEQAAELTAALRLHLTVPHHYAFTSGRLGDRLLTKSDSDPRHFIDAARRLASESATRVPQPGEPLAITSANPASQRP